MRVQIMQHIYQKSGYHYRKRTSFNHLAYLSIGPGLIHAQGTYPYLQPFRSATLMSLQEKYTSAIARS